jgi:probable F420-dependent oxidoreductase
MKIGLHLWARGERVAELAALAEHAGCESVWVSEHLVWPVAAATRYPYSETGVAPVPENSPLYDPWVLLASAAAATERIRLGTWVYILPLRHHFVTARAVATLDILSGGRVILGAGLGWLREEFDLAGAEFDSRSGRADELAQALRVLWSASPASFAGRHVSFAPVHFEPKPPQGDRLPIQFGGESQAALRRAAQVGDGWLGMQHGIDSARLRVAQLLELRAASPRSGIPFETTVTPGHWPVEAEEVAAYREAGVSRLIVHPWRKGYDRRRALDEVGELIGRL